MKNFCLFVLFATLCTHATAEDFYRLKPKAAPEGETSSPDNYSLEVEGFSVNGRYGDRVAGGGFRISGSGTMAQAAREDGHALLRQRDRAYIEGLSAVSAPAYGVTPVIVQPYRPCFKRCIPVYVAPVKKPCGCGH